MAFGKKSEIERGFWRLGMKRHVAFGKQGGARLEMTRNIS
ncbi:hypothetical protein HMPREF9069_00667 [Atopobium sp. oral taxon 810 str. F0209]|nr:hypothetical protein HMPREF9069_00667 [Atopobium sp. oral taxon 810 str. F0209]